MIFPCLNIIWLWCPNFSLKNAKYKSFSGDGNIKIIKQDIKHRSNYTMNNKITSIYDGKSRKNRARKKHDIPFVTKSRFPWSL